MITGLIVKAMFAIARMSKRASLIYIIVLSTVFWVATGMFLHAMILVDPEGVIPPYAYTLLTISIVMLFVSTAGVALTTIASNYVRKNPYKDPKANKEENIEEK
jgi:predicted tellurium resistance membrane protein TerC